MLVSLDRWSPFKNMTLSSGTGKSGINRKRQQEPECTVIAVVCCIILLRTCLAASRLLLPQGNAASTQAAETRRYTGMSLDVNKKYSREKRVINTEHHNQALLSRVEMKLAKFARGIHLHRCNSLHIMSAMFTQY